MKARLIIKLTGGPGCAAVFLNREEEFHLRPQVGEQIQIAKRRHKVANFFHNLDQNCIDVVLIQEWNEGPDALNKLKSEMEAGGWQCMQH